MKNGILTSSYEGHLTSKVTKIIEMYKGFTVGTAQKDRFCTGVI